MTQQFFTGPPLQRSLRIGGVILLAVLVVVGLSYFSRTSRSFWIDSISVDELKAEGAKHPEDGELNFMLAYRLMKDGRDPEAYAVMQQVTQRYPNDVRYLLRLGDCTRNLAHTVETVGVYKRVLKIDPNRADVYLELGLIYGEAGLQTDALENFEHGSKLDPTALVNYSVWVNCMLAKGRYQEAWDKTIAVLAKDSRAEEIYGAIYTAGVALGKSKEAEQFLLNHMGMFNNYHGSPAKTGLARLMIAADHQKKTLDTAEMLTTEASTGQGSRPDDFAALGEIRLLKKDLKGARSALEEGLSRDPTDPSCLKVLIEVSKQEGKKAETESLQKRLTLREEGVPEVAAQRKRVRAAPNDAKAHLALALALEKAGSFGPGAEECHEALRLAPNDPAAAAELEVCRAKALQKLEKESIESNVH